MTEPLYIRPTPPERHAAALELLFSNLSVTEKAAQMALSLAAVRRRRVTLEGLLSAERKGRLVGVVWITSLGGKSALVWPPQLVAGEAETTANALLCAADEWMRSRGITLATAYLLENASPEARRLAAAGYVGDTTIAYLMSRADAFPEFPPAERLEFAPFSNADWPRLAAIVDATYVGTRDCPKLNGMRDTRDVLEAYRSAGDSSPEHWLIVRNENEDVGCLLLADHADDDHYELVYMGVVPPARGRDFGIHITRHAQWLTRCAGRASLVLAVDAENSPAIRGYVACGFQEWERRRVFLKSVLP